jgi:hypothetical protein
MYYSSWSGYQGGGAAPGPLPGPPTVQPPPAGPGRAEQRQPEPRRTEAMPAGAGSAADVFSIWRPTSALDPVLGNPDDERVTEPVNRADRPEFPPSENDPRAAYGWRRSSAPPPPDGSRSGGRQQDEAAADPADVQTRADFTYPDSPTRRDLPPSETAPAPETVRRARPAEPVGNAAVHDALSQVDDDDDQVQSRSDVSNAGIALNWDDE